MCRRGCGELVVVTVFVRIVPVFFAVANVDTNNLSVTVCQKKTGQ